MRTLTKLFFALLLVLPLGGDVTVVVGQKPVVAGGASAFTLVQSKTGSNDGGGVASVTMDAAITAGSVVVIFAKAEGDGGMTAASVNGGSATLLTAQNQSDLDVVGAYVLSATAGSTVSFTWSGASVWTRVIVRESSYGGTASFVTSASAGGDSNPGVATIETGDVTNSGTHRLNVAFAGLYSSTTPTTPRIGGSAGSNFLTISDTHGWWTNGSLAGGANDDADIQYSADTRWTMYLMCFAAN